MAIAFRRWMIGTTAERPSSGTTSQAFLDRTNGKLYYGTGSGWTEIDYGAGGSWPGFSDAEGDPAALGTAADGTSTYPARRDHVHSSSHAHAPADVTGTAVVTNDARLSDARTPTQHALDSTSLHSALSDNTNFNATTGQHGFLPKLGGGTSNFLRADGTWAAAGGAGAAPAWHGAIYGAMGGCNPNDLLQMLLNNPVNATPTNITVSLARGAYFRPPANITVNKIRAFGVGATTNIYRCAIYATPAGGARLTSELVFSTTAQAWVAIGSGIGLTLTAGTLYAILVSVNATGTTAGCACLSSTTGRLGVLPASWPGNLDIDMASPIIDPVALFQCAVSTGALPTTLPTIAAQGAWTGGMPAFFLDANNA